MTPEYRRGIEDAITTAQWSEHSCPDERDALGWAVKKMKKLLDPPPSEGEVHDAPAGAASCEFCGKEYAVVPGMLRECCALGHEDDKRCRTCGGLLGPRPEDGLVEVVCPYYVSEAGPDGPPWSDCRFWKSREGT